MYKAEPNTTKHRPVDLPFLVRETESTLITRFCATESEAEQHAQRINRRYFPEAVSKTPAKEEAPVVYGETLSLF